MPKLKLLKSYCTILYGYELSILFHDAISDVCVAGRSKGLRTVWSLPYNTKTAILEPLCGSIPTADEICRRTLSFTADCTSYICNFVSFFSRYMQTILVACFR